MADKKPVVVYGVSGYTGRLVCEYLREYNIPFIAAGRDKKRVSQEAAYRSQLSSRRSRIHAAVAMAVESL